MYGRRKRGFSSPAHQRSLRCDCSGKGALSEPSSVFDFTESPVEFQKSLRSPRKRLLQNASIPRLRNFETADYFKEAPEEQRPRWTQEKQPERRQSLSPTPKKQKSGSTQLELGELSKEKNASPKKTTVPDNLSDLFEGLPQSPRKSTLDIRTVNIISSEEPEPQIPKVALEPPSIPTVNNDGQSVSSPPKPHISPRNYARQHEPTAQP
ncbi:hypothetical protein KL919_000577 [Ogataea angusta]|nr:hypothetical protein KL919_000577 [Ogataea angusta]